ncbi:MAG: serine protease [Verrucomicrobia bacterium]|nr:trypsin-like peptidase domain-containing protein [Verrucomicrobiota bacterium]MDA0723145.1 serine protease [Verrucomicrobiota bacterium]MDA1046319.1 serine protease [Verrucomicrobiota bacterium]
MNLPKSLYSLILFACLAGSTVAQQSKTAFIDDLALELRFQKGLEGLHETGKGTSLNTLSGQLNRRTTTVKLPETKLESIHPDEFYSRCKASVLAVGRLYQCGKCTKWHVSSASGFALSEDGVIATNYHVVDSKEGVALGAMDSNGKTFVVSEVLAANKSADVALLRLRDAKLTPLPLAVRAPVGTAVSVISHPDGRYFTMTKGDVSRYFVARSKTGQANRMAITADYAKGSSGAPVLDSTGAVVGMVSATNSIYYSKVKGHNENLQMVVKSCVPVDAIHRLLRGDNLLE